MNTDDVKDGELVAGRYRVLRQLGRGGMGDVVVARHETLGRDVALKRMRGDVANKDDARARMLREARALGALRHENIVDVIDAGDDGSGLFIAMELVNGETLRERMKRSAPRGVPLHAALEVVRQMAEGLAAAHAAGVVHRDLKPENVMLTSTSASGSASVAERAKILDFGLARAVENSETVTEHGVVVGTPGYIAPEVGTRGAYGPAADVYALGVIMYELAKGAPPWTAETGMSLLLKHITEPVPSPSIAPDVDALIVACLDKDPAKRPTPKEIAARCRAIVEGGSSPTLTSALRTPEGVTPPSPSAAPSTSVPHAHMPNAQTSATGTAAPHVPYPPPPLHPHPPPPSRTPLIMTAMIGFVVIVVAAFAFIRGGDGGGDATRPPPPPPPPPGFAGPPSGPLRAGDPFPPWNLTRVSSQAPTAERPAKWGPSQWLAHKRTAMLVVVVKEPCATCVAVLDDLERLRMLYPNVSVTLVNATDNAKAAIDTAVEERAKSSSVDVVLGYMPSIGESTQQTDFAAIAFHNGWVTRVERGLVARGQLDSIAASLANK